MHNESSDLLRIGHSRRIVGTFVTRGSHVQESPGDIWIFKSDESKSSGSVSVTVKHDNGVNDGSKLLKEVVELLIGHCGKW